MVVFFGLVIMVDMKSLVKTGGFILFIITGIGYYLARKEYCRRKGVYLADLLYQEKWADEQ